VACYIYQSDKRFLGFTLIELVTVIAVIAMLLAILLPAVLSARSAVRSIDCANKMRQIGIAIHSYNIVHAQLPPSKWGKENDTDSDNIIGHNILTFLLPYLEQHDIYNMINFSVDWRNNANKTATEREMPIFQCPETPRKNRHKSFIYYVADYAVAESMQKTNDDTNTPPERYGTKHLFDNGIVSARDNLHGMLQPDGKAVTVESVSDGLSNTMMFFECAARPFTYKLHRVFDSSVTILSRASSSADWASNKAPFYIQDTCGAGSMQLMNCTNNEEIYSFHVGGANFLFGDGAVHFIQDSTHPEPFISRFTATAGDVASPP
jgi:prepilin-type N-terminal cleavage/methylation domain-containing protein